MHTYADGPNTYTISATATDEDGTFSAVSLTVTVNNVAPIPIIQAPLEVDEEIEFSIIVTFTDPGILDWHTYTINWGDLTSGGGTASGFTIIATHTYEDPGTFLIEITVTDNDGDAGSTIPFLITVLDKTPPVTTLTLGCHYIDEFGATYVSSSTPFTLEATDEYSGVAQIFYSFDGMIWEPYGTAFSIDGPDGPYTIYYYSVDVAGNDEDPVNTQDVFLISLDVNSYLTDSDFNPITYFDYIFRKDKPDGFTLVATNPGQFYYHIEVVNTWPIPIDTLTITADLPEDFILKGAMPIHVYLDGDDITELCTINPITCTATVSNIPVGSMVWVTIHMDYDLKGVHRDSIEDFILKSYQFDAIASGGGILTGTYDSSSILIGHQKKTAGICGFVIDTNGNPMVVVVVYLYSGDGSAELDTAVTDVNGFYYFINLDEANYIISIGPIDTAIVIMVVTVKKDEFTEANLLYEDP